jgi:hypothetical protein
MVDCQRCSGVSKPNNYTYIYSADDVDVHYIYGCGWWRGVRFV